MNAGGANPFSTRFVRPGAIPYLLPGGQNTEHLAAALAKADWRGQIVGPHGSGKSTLLASLEGPLAALGRKVWTVTLRDGQRRMPKGWTAQVHQAAANLIVVDGYEQLGWLSRGALRARCRWHGWGLLVTAHGDVGLPTLWTSLPDVQTAQAIVGRLQSGDRLLVSPELVSECFAAAGGDVREMLFRLYDRCEAQSRETAAIEPKECRS